LGSTLAWTLRLRRHWRSRASTGQVHVTTRLSPQIGLSDAPAVGAVLPIFRAGSQGRGLDNVNGFVIGVIDVPGPPEHGAIAGAYPGAD